MEKRLRKSQDFRMCRFLGEERYEIIRSGDIMKLKSLVSGIQDIDEVDEVFDELLT